jgi:hypothetical protein
MTNFYHDCIFLNHEEVPGNNEILYLLVCEVIDFFLLGMQV